MSFKQLSKNRAGFSLLELSVVMFLMMILLGFALPRFSAALESDLQKTIQKIALILNELKIQAVLKGKNYKLVFDTSKSEYSVLAQNFNDLQFYPHEKYPRPIPLKESIQFFKVAKDKEKDESENFSFDEIEFEDVFGHKREFMVNSSGLIDLFTITLKDEDNHLSLSVVNVMGKIVIGEETPL